MILKCGRKTEFRFRMNSAVHHRCNLSIRCVAHYKVHIWIKRFDLLKILRMNSNWPLEITLQMIFRDLVAFVLLPLLALYPVFSFLHPDYSTQECLNIFAILTVCNCFIYLSKLTAQTFDWSRSPASWTCHYLQVSYCLLTRFPSSLSLFYLKQAQFIGRQEFFSSVWTRVCMGMLTGIWLDTNSPGIFLGNWPLWQSFSIISTWLASQPLDAFFCSSHSH